MMKLKDQGWVILVLILIAALTRIIPHYPNFTAVGAAALFGGAFLSRRLAILIPVVALFLSNLVLNNLIYSQLLPGNQKGFIFFEITSLWIYGAFIAIALLGSFLIRRRKLYTIVGTSLLASSLFFLVSNAAVWMHSAMYPKTAEGLMAALLAGVPFFWNTIAGDLFYVAVFFGSVEVIRAFKPAFLQPVTA